MVKLTPPVLRVPLDSAVQLGPMYKMLSEINLFANDTFIYRDLLILM